MNCMMTKERFECKRKHNLLLRNIPNGKYSMKKYYYEYFREFLAYITSEENHTPIGFFSFHKYFTGVSSILDYTAMVADIKKNLEEYGLSDIELICTEWNITLTDTNKTMKASATVSTTMVKRVYVHAPQIVDGKRTQEIDIVYDLVGILPQSLFKHEETA